MSSEKSNLELQGYIRWVIRMRRGVPARISYIYDRLLRTGKYPGLTTAKLKYHLMKMAAGGAVIVKRVGNVNFYRLPKEGERHESIDA